MILTIKLVTFYSIGDEDRFFYALGSFSSVNNFKGLGRELIINLNANILTKIGLMEIIALFWRYGIDLKPMKIFAEIKKFEWISENKWYWHKKMFG